MMLPEIEKTLRVNSLMDIYGLMLTGRQHNTLELYYKDDLSLAEIAAELNISRQAVHDLIQRGIQVLEDLELKLEFYSRGKNIRKQLEYTLLLLEKKDLEQAAEVIKEIQAQEPY